MNDGALLQEFARHKSEAAFQELVRRHGRLVYSCARQRVGDPHAAEDIAQSVFLALAIQAPKLPADIALAGWLYRVTRYTAAKYQRQEKTRREREMKAHQDQQLQGGADNTAALWQEIQPHLAAALDGLSATDREAVLLRFYNDSSYRQVGQSLRITEEAAKKRVLRALERVRRFLAKRGVRIGAGALAATLGAQAAEAMPVTVAAQTVKTALALGSGTMASTATSTLMLAKGALHAMFIAKVKTVSLAAAACLVLAGTGVVAAKQLSAPSGTQPTTPVLVTAQADTPRTVTHPRLPEPSQPSTWPTTAPAASKTAEASVEVRARIVKAVDQQPAGYAMPENWIVEAVKSLPVNKPAGHQPPAFVAVASDWQTLVWNKPTVIEVQYLRTTINLSYGEQIKLSGMLESGDARAHLPQMSLLAEAGATTVNKLTNGGYYLAVQVIGAEPHPVTLPEPPVPAPVVQYTQGRIAKIVPGQLTLHVLRGPSGIMKSITTDDQTEVYLADGVRGTLADLAVDQWIKVTLDAEGKRALRIKPGAAPWETTVPAEYSGATDLLKRWLAAIDANDLAAYQQCLHSEAVKVNEYGTAEALAFWSRQVKDLHKEGFRGQWEFQKPTEYSPRYPAGSVQAHPVLNGKASSEFILLIQENGQWVILRLFS